MRLKRSSQAWHGGGIVLRMSPSHSALQCTKRAPEINCQCHLCSGASEGKKARGAVHATRAFTDSTMDDGRTGRDKYLSSALRSLYCHVGSTYKAEMICFALVGDVLVFSTKFFECCFEDCHCHIFLPCAPRYHFSSGALCFSLQL